MSNDKTVTAAGETSVRNESHLVAKTTAHEGGRWAQHLAHSRSALRTLVADYDDISGAHATCENRRGRALFAVEHPRRTAERQALPAGDLRDRPFRGQVAVQHDEMTVFFQWVGQGSHDVLPRRVGSDVREVLGERRAGDAHALAVQIPGIEERF